MRPTARDSDKYFSIVRFSGWEIYNFLVGEEPQASVILTKNQCPIVILTKNVALVNFLRWFLEHRGSRGNCRRKAILVAILTPYRDGCCGPVNVRVMSLQPRKA